MSTREQFIQNITDCGAYSIYAKEEIETRIEKHGYYITEELLVKDFDVNDCTTGTSLSKFYRASGITLSQINIRFRDCLSVCYLPVGFYNVDKLASFLTENMKEPNKKGRGRPKLVTVSE